MDDTALERDEYPSEMEPDALAAWIAAERRKDSDAAATWREEARQMYDFVAGRQWTPEDMAVLDEQGRPAVTFNRVAPLVDAVCGAQLANRQEMTFLPRSGDDGGKSELVGGVVRWVRDECDAEDEESNAFRDTVICGMGWTGTSVCYDYGVEGKIIEERIDPFEMVWDRTARKKNLADAKRVGRALRLSETDVRATWPQFFGAVKAGQGIPPDAPSGHRTQPTRDQYADGDSDTQRDDDIIEVFHAQWCEERPEYHVLNDVTQQPTILDAEQWEALGEKLGMEVRDGLKWAKRKDVRWFQAYQCGGEVAEVGECPDPQGPTYKVITGRWDRNKRQFYGLVREAIDPQKWANKWLVQGMHILNTSAKSGVLYEEGAVKDARLFEESYAKAGSLTEVAAGALSGGRLIPKQSAGFPAGFSDLMQFAISSIPDVTGLNREMLGSANRDQPGILEAQRKQAAQSTLAPLFDSLRRYYKNQGRLLLVFCQKYIPPSKWLRVTTPDGDPAMVQLAMMPDMTEFDIIVDQAPTSPNQKTEVWQALQPMLPVLVKEVPAPILLKMLKFSPLPESVVKDMEKEVQAMAQQPPPPDPAMMKAQADIQTTQAKAQAELALKAAEMKQAQEMAQLEYQTELRKAQMELEVSRMKAEQEMALARMKSEHDAMMRQQAADTDVAIAERKATVENEARAHQMKSDKEILAAPVAEMVAPLRDAIASLAELQAQIAEQGQRQAEHLAALIADTKRLVSAPREVVRDGNGKISGARIAMMN